MYYLNTLNNHLCYCSDIKKTNTKDGSSSTHALNVM